MCDLDREIDLIRAFFQPIRRDRAEWMVSTPGKRIKFINRLAHCRDLDERFTTWLAPSVKHTPDILRLLRERGAPETCYVVSLLSCADGKIMPLEDALDAVVGISLGSLISCIPGRLAFFESEDRGARCILERPATGSVSRE
ncbi:MAG: hypothetical protein HYV27_02665 [Candidatus Hydrogenedentes bacterium]|nr:hypothetical protein [Candidatus Hydrogenedentota bacterium]